MSLIVFAIAVVLLCFAIYRFLSAPQHLISDIDQYKGDGKATFLGGRFMSYGFAITFESFDLTKDFEHRYRITRLPRIDKECSLTLEIPGGVEQLDRVASGKLSLKLLTQDGKSIVSYSGPISTWDRANVYHHDIHTPFGVLMHYGPDATTGNTGFSYQQTGTGENLEVVVSYTAGPDVPKGTSGRVCVSSGGSW